MESITKHDAGGAIREEATMDRRTMLATAAAATAGIIGVLAAPGVAEAALGDPLKACTFDGENSATPVVDVVNAGGDAIAGGCNAPTKSGVYGFANAAASYGVFARNDHGGTALGVSGGVSLSRSGTASIGKNKSSVSITVPGGPLTGSSKFLVTLQKTAGSGVFVAYAKKTSSTKFKVYLNKKASTSSSVSWMVLD